MQTLVLIIHILVTLTLVGIILIQRSEGGGLGIGGGGGGFMTARGTANFLTVTTKYLAAVFFATSIGLTVLSRTHHKPHSILDAAPEIAPIAAPGDGATPKIDLNGPIETRPSTESSPLPRNNSGGAAAPIVPTVPNAAANSASPPLPIAPTVPNAPSNPSAPPK